MAEFLQKTNALKAQLEKLKKEVNQEADK